VARLLRTKDPRVPQVLLGLLDDATVAAFAVEALGKLTYAPARTVIEALLDSPDKNVRAQEKSLRRLAGR
jgi:hypothetical protein